MNPNTEAAAQLVEEAGRTHRSALVRYAARLLRDEHRAEDVVQDVFVRLHAQPAEALREHLAEWLFTVCRRRAFDVLRKEGRMSSWEEREAAGAEPAHTDEDEGARARLVAAEDRALLLRLIGTLPAPQQEVLRLKFQSGFSYQQIARITNRSTSHVGVLIHEAVTALRRDWRAAAAS